MSGHSNTMGSMAEKKVNNPWSRVLIICHEKLKSHKSHGEKLQNCVRILFMTQVHMKPIPNKLQHR